MRVGIGLPNVIPGTTGEVMLEWARRAEDGPFTSLGVLDRVAYASHEPLASLAAASALTERLRLVTMVVVGPLRTTGVLAKEAETLRALSGDRLTLGLGLGARLDDYQASGVEPRGRGRRFDDQLEELRARWPDGDRPELLVGGGGDAAFARAARYADGYVHGGGPPRAFARAADGARAAWRDGGRPGEPALWGQSYFALGAGAPERGRAYMLDYYAFTGAFAERVADGLLTTPQAIAQQLRGYGEAGCDELVLLPAVSDVDQVERLAEALP